MKKHLFSRIVILALIVLLVLLFSYSAWKLFSSLSTEDDPTPAPGTHKTLLYNGEEYFPRQDITTFLLMGIDRRGPVTDSGSYNNDGLADLLALICFDEKKETYNVLLINRDTVTEMNVLGIGGKTAGTKTAQIALAHSYGNGLEISCENTADAVSRLLGGIQIDHYMSINMDTIAILNDAVGGVTVDVQEDFSAIDPEIPMGTFTLHGEQALTFVRGRQNVGDELNTSRIVRQQAYIEGYLAALSDTLSQNTNFVVDTYGKIDPYCVTDLSATTLNTMFSRYADYEFSGALTLQGTTAHPNGFMEFYPDKDALNEIIFTHYFAKKS